MVLRTANKFGSSVGGFLWLLVLAVTWVSGQDCQTEMASVTGTEFGGENTFDCAEGAYASEVHVSIDTVGFVGFILLCSDGESKVFGVCFGCGDWYHNVDCTGGLTEMSLTPSLDEDDEYPANANFFCYNEDNPSGTSLGPYPPEGGNPDTSAEITWSSCADGTYAAGISAFESFFLIFGVALRCRTIDEASCPAPDGLLVPGTTGTTGATDDDTSDPATSIPTPEPTSESTTEPTAEPTPTPVSIPTPEPTSESTTEPTAEPTPTPVSIPTPEPTSESTTEPTAEPTPTPVSIPTPEPTSESTTEPTAEPTPTPVSIPTPEPTSESTTEPTPEPMPAPVPATGVPTQVSSTGQPQSPTPSPFSAMTPRPSGGEDTPAATPTPVGGTLMPTLLDKTYDDESYVDGTDSPATPSTTPQITLELTADPTPVPTLTPVSGTTLPAHVNPTGQRHPPTSSPVPILAPPTDTGAEPPATAPPPTGATITPTSSPSSIATPASGGYNDMVPTTATPSGSTLAPIPSDREPVPPGADDDNDDSSGDDGFWTETAKTVVGAVASLVAVVTLCIACTLVRGRSRSEHGINQNGGNTDNASSFYNCGGRNSISNILIQSVRGIHNAIGNRSNNTLHGDGEHRNINNIRHGDGQQGKNITRHRDGGHVKNNTDEVFMSARSSPV